MIEFYDISPEAEELINKVYDAALRHFNQPDVFSVEISGIEADDMRELNNRSRGVDSVTDVLSFPNLEIKSLPVDANDFKQDVDFETGKILLGDIVICFDKVRSQAEEYGHGEERECAYLALHGLLHLLGFDHAEDGDRAVMRGHEEAILGSLNILR